MICEKKFKPRGLNNTAMWSPDPATLEQFRSIFKATLSLNNNERHSANDALSQARTQPEFENYLCDLLINSNATSDVRAAAGINLKNSVLKKPSTDRQHLLDSIMAGLLVEDTMVRNITGNVITSLFSSHGIQGWPQALPNLLRMAESGPPAAREAAVGALAKICEDSARTLDTEYNGERPSDYITVQLLRLATAESSTGKIRAQCVHSLNQFVPLKSQLILVLLDQFLHTLFALAHDESTDVRKNVCTAFLCVLEARPDKLVPHIDGLVDYCLHLIQDPSEEVAMEACEFLLALSESPSADHKEVFRPKLKLVLPVLLETMVYADEQIFLMQILDERDDARVADNDEDVRPNMAKAKTHNVGKNQDSDSESDDDEDDLDLWNLRRCSAATLDALSLDYPDEVIAVTLPILHEKIVSPEWPVREAAILAFGAMAKGCIELARDQLPTLVPFLVERLKDSETRVRQITCWTIARFAGWVAEEAHDGGNYASYFQPTFEAVVQCALDPKKIVQESACSALASFVESTDVSLIQYYVGPLLEHFSKCFQTYQRRNMITLYDCVLTFVDKIGPDVFTPDYANILLPPLLQNWQLLDDNDTDLWPLLECMSVVAATMGELFAPYAVPVYERAVKILANAVQLNLDVHTDPAIEAPEKDFIVTSLDLIDGLVQGFKEHSVDLMEQHGQSLMDILLVCFEDHDDDVRQLAYALLGDLSIFACLTVTPYLGSIVICIGNEINNCSYASYPVTNNAIWAFGELALKANPHDLQPFMANMVGLLIPVLNSTDTQQTVLENAAICVGRLGLAGGSGEVAPRMAEFIYSWCAQILTTLENEEKETAFLGMLNTVQLNPDQGFGGLSNQQGRKNLSVFVSCIGNYMEPSDKLRELFYQLLQSYKGLLGESWPQIMGLIDAETRGALQAYGV